MSVANASMACTCVTTSRLRPGCSCTSMWANGSSRAPNLLRVRRTPFATARTRPCSRVSRVTIRSASPSLCWRSTTARSRYNRIATVSHCGPTTSGRSTRPSRIYILGANMAEIPPTTPRPKKNRFPTLTQQLYQLASSRVTSEELVQRSLRAITVSQSTLNAFRVVMTDQALADARAADRKRAAGQYLPLLGIPVAVKDDVDVAGTPTRFGTSGAVPNATADAEVVRRLRAAGAIIVGKTNTCELGQWPFTSGPAFGHTRNPWSREHTPGGSSGGSAAAVAAGLVAAAIGSDGAGSVRIPAAWTHLVGIKPQRGRISTWPRGESFQGITVNGTLARTVADAALLLDAASGNHAQDPHRPPAVRAAEAVGRDPGRLRIALALKPPFTALPARLQPQVRARVVELAEKLSDLGHTVEEADPPYGQIGLTFIP